MNRFSLGLLSLILFVPMASRMPANANEIGFVETFALAEDRDAVLKQLIPGTEDYYFYTALHYQNTQRFDEVEKLLKPWIKRYGQTGRVRQIQHRQALLTYSQNPQPSLAYLKDVLNLEFNHQQEKLGSKPRLPIELDPQLYDHQRLAARAFKRHQNLDGFTQRSLPWLADRDLTPLQRRHLLERLDRPDVPQLPQLVVADLTHKDSRGFGTFGIHRQLLQSQLDECLDLAPDLINSTAFVETYITKLRPTEDVNWRYDPRELGAYLDRLTTFVRRLDPEFQLVEGSCFLSPFGAGPHAGGTGQETVHGIHPSSANRTLPQSTLCQRTRVAEIPGRSEPGLLVADAAAGDRRRPSLSVRLPAAFLHHRN